MTARMPPCRPWGLLHWVLERIPAFQWTLLGCLGTEQRSTVVWKEMNTRLLLADTRLLRIRDTASTPYAVATSSALDERTDDFIALGGNANSIQDLILHAAHSQIVGAVD